MALSWLLTLLQVGGSILGVSVGEPNGSSVGSSPLFDEQLWQSFWSFVAGAGLVGCLWALQTIRNLLPDEITADESHWVDPWNTLKEKSWKVIVENSEYYYNHIGELPSRPKAKTRSHWPWETIRRRVFSTQQDSMASTSDDELSDKIQSSGTGSGIQKPNNINGDDDHISERKDQEKMFSPGDSAKEGDGIHGDKANGESSSTRDKDDICIGSIFGMDVGGSLAKLVYFEQKPSDYDPMVNPSRERQYTMAASAQTVLMARSSASSNTIPLTSTKTMTTTSSTYRVTGETHGVWTTTPRRRSLSLGCFSRFKDLQRQHQTQDVNTENGTNPSTHVTETSSSPSSPVTSPERRKSHPGHQTQAMHSAACLMELQNLKDLRQESVPDDLAHFRDTIHFKATDPAISKRSVSFRQDDEDAPTVNASSDQDEKMKQPSPIPPPSKIRKSRSMFNLSPSQKKAVALDRFYSFARRLDSYENSVRDHQLSFFSRELGGEFHFLHFESRWMTHAMDLIRYHNLHLNIAKMGATGGGAHKYADEWENLLGIQMDKQDELESLVAGMQFVLSTVVGECYTFRPHEKKEPAIPNPMPPKREVSSISVCSAGSESESGFVVKDEHVGAPLLDESFPDTEEEQSSKKKQNFSRPSPMSSPRRSKNAKMKGSTETSSNDASSAEPDKNRVDEWWWSRKVQRDAISYSTAYPYLLVTIGTGVSILRVDGPRKHERISGSTIGGGTYWGLIRLLTDVEDFEDVMRLAEKGDPAKVDMMVGDIYGENSDALEKLGLASNIVASSFGKLVAKEDPAAGLEQEDLARALLLMITNNIGQVAYLNAKLHMTPRIYFVGNFLRNNMLSQRRLSYAIDYWSKGEMEALFLEHEGYFGALGAFLISQKIAQDEEGFFQWDKESNPAGGDDQDGSESAMSDRKSPSYYMHRRLKTFGA